MSLCTVLNGNTNSRRKTERLCGACAGKLIVNVMFVEWKTDII